MATEYRYPHESSPTPTASWVPTVCPAIPDSGQDEDDGIVRGRAAGGRPVLYQVSDPTEFIVHKFILPSWDEVTNSTTGWRAFRDAVMGRRFRAKDDMIGGFVTVALWQSPKWRAVERKDSGALEVEGEIVLLRVVGV